MELTLHLPDLRATLEKIYQGHPSTCVPPRPPTIAQLKEQLLELTSSVNIKLKSCQVQQAGGHIHYFKAALIFL